MGNEPETNETHVGEDFQKSGFWFFFGDFGDLDIVDFHSNGRENFHDHRISIGIGFREPQPLDTTVKTFSSKSYHQKSLIWGDVFWEISIIIGKAPAKSSTFWPASPLYPILGGFLGTARAAGNFEKTQSLKQFRFTEIAPFAVKISGFYWTCGSWDPLIPERGWGKA